MPKHIKLGLNIDHVATLREARGGVSPSVLEAARQVITGGAEGITIHLREDRRHIQDADVRAVAKKIPVPLNLEMSIAPDVVRVACQVKPEKACLVPEKRQELTTEGGLDVFGQHKKIQKVVERLQKNKILVSLFIDPIPAQIRASYAVGADYIELHTGTYANAKGKKRASELRRLKEGAKLAHELGLGVNAGHGLDYQNVKPIARLPHLYELNIGHSIVSESVFCGLKSATRKMKRLIREA